jgi:hypothetical protein
MNKVEELKAQVEHMESRTQWHEKDIERVEQMRNELTALQNDGELTAEMKEQNKVVHHH